MVERAWRAADERMNKIVKELQLLEAAGGTVFMRRATPESIDVALIEAAIDVIFPQEVRTYFQTFEYLQIGTREIEWLRNIPELTAGLRAKRSDLPRDLIPVEDDGSGGYYYVRGVLPEQNDVPSEAEIVHNPSGVVGMFELVSFSFLDFLEDHIREARENQ